MRKPLTLMALLVLGALVPAAGSRLAAQQNQASAAPPSDAGAEWVHELRVEGHLALHGSPDGAFSPDGSDLAVVGQHRIILLNLETGRGIKALHPAIPGLEALDIDSANYIASGRLFILAHGLARIKGQSAPVTTPPLGFQWDIASDALYGKVEELGAQGGFLPPVYFPRIHRLALYKNGVFTLWDPASGLAEKYSLPSITHPPRLFAFSPDGAWLLLAQIEMNASPNPVVISAKQHAPVNVLPGHHGAVLSMTFSRDGKLLETSCEDTKVRVWTVPGWALAATLAGNTGPVHWAEFSPDGSLIASAGEDATVRIWRVADSKLIRTLAASRDPLLTVAFSPDGTHLVATSENSVEVWKAAP